MLPGPVLNVELITTARRARYYAVRLLYGLAILYLVFQNYYAWDRMRGGTFSTTQMSNFAYSTFASFAGLQAICVLALTPGLVAGVIVNEKQRKTLHYLLASQLSSGEIVLGKLAARMLHVGVFLAIGLPVMSLLSLFGGVDPIVVILVYLATFTTAFFLASASVLISIMARRVRDAITQAYTLETAWLIVPYLIQVLMPMSWPRVYAFVRPVNDAIVVTNPFNLLSGALLRGNLNSLAESAAWLMGSQVAYGTAFALIAIWRLRPVFKNQEGTAPRRFFGLAAKQKWYPRLLRRPEVGDDAMLWKERYTSRSQGWAKLAGYVVIAGLLILLAYWTVDFGYGAVKELIAYGYGDVSTNSERQDFNWYLRWVCSLLTSLALLGVTTASASGITSEKEEDTWVSLLATPLGRREILRGKMVGAAWKVRGFLAVAAALWLIGLACGSIHPLGLLLLLVEVPVFIWFGAALGTFLSLRSKSTWRSQTLASAALLAVTVGYMACCCPFYMDSRGTYLLAVGCSPFIMFASLFSPGEYKELMNGNLQYVPPGKDAELIVTCLACLFLYAAAAIGLTFACISRFDASVDRPRRPGIGFLPPLDEPPRKPKETLPVGRLE